MSFLKPGEEKKKSLSRVLLYHGRISPSMQEFVQLGCARSEAVSIFSTGVIIFRVLDYLARSQNISIRQKPHFSGTELCWL